jgi:hypothetical protein
MQVEIPHPAFSGFGMTFVLLGVVGQERRFAAESG